MTILEENAVWTIFSGVHFFSLPAKQAGIKEAARFFISRDQLIPDECAVVCHDYSPLRVTLVFCQAYHVTVQVQCRLVLNG